MNFDGVVWAEGSGRCGRVLLARAADDIDELVRLGQGHDRGVDGVVGLGGVVALRQFEYVVCGREDGTHWAGVLLGVGARGAVGIMCGGCTVVVRGVRGRRAFARRDRVGGPYCGGRDRVVGWFVCVAAVDRFSARGV